MKILEIGNEDLPVVLLIHGFESPYSIWSPYINRYKDKYHFIIPILPGHDKEHKEDQFTTLSSVVDNIIAFLSMKHIKKLFAIYGMSMGGIVATELWKRHYIKVSHLILESSPLKYFNSYSVKFLSKNYLSINKKARQRDNKVLVKATKTMVTKDKLNDLLDVIDTISDESVFNYLTEISKFTLPTQNEIQKSDKMCDTFITYYYGTKITEYPFKKVAKYLSKNYKNLSTYAIKGKGHCELSLLEAENWFYYLDKIFC